MICLNLWRPAERGACRRSPANLAAGLLALVLSAAAQATVYTDLQLSQLPADSAQFVLPGDAGEATLTITELGAAGTGTMTGSDFFGYQGLWLGSAGTSGGYTFSFSQAVGRLSISFIALSAQGVNGEDGIETLAGFHTDNAIQISFSSPSGSAAWDGSAVTPLDEDGRGVLQFQALAAGFTQLQFEHLQPLPLNGFVINRIEYSAAVPEPSMVLLSLAGALALLGWRRRTPSFTGFGRPGRVYL